ncbi:MAG: tRNA uridine(34) 5-carboxymethylaminomethyl modification radical SAM/GNAT enzyme Elp3 [Thermoplasmata archaeon]|nr:tRNA uridine(34) 5-carboxymethylaminomethyl modification radical SAM/GNAT enzyme Elp3 [Thermoplasmata archaeon]
MAEKERVLRGIAERIMAGKISSREELEKAKRDAAFSLGLSSLPSNADILAAAGDLRGSVEDFLRLKPSRTLSGVTVVAVMTSPHECPHGRCIYCPGGPEKGTAQSYTGREPAALRAAQQGFDPFRQVRQRLRQLEEIGHPTDKIDLIIMGGTFTARDRGYQEWFVKRCFDALNDAPRESGSLGEAHLLNETARHRCIGLTVETRPDRFMEREIEYAIRLGATRVELGVQTTFDNVLRLVERGHTTEETKRSTMLARDRGLKICYHMMPGLPGSTREMDLQAFKTIFTDPEYMPDMLKLYPTLVVEGTRLYDMWKKGEYEPLDTEAAARLVADMKEIVPPWVRIQRVQRDIPSHLVVAGVKKSNLRQLAQDILRERGKTCRCIRCREVGRKEYGGYGGETLPGSPGDGISPGRPEAKPEVVEYTYPAGGGREAFISLEYMDALIGYVRIRRPSPESPFSNLALVRELKVFGEEQRLGVRGRGWQHRGYGRRLMSLAEERAEEWGMKGVRVTAGVGIRPYYRKMGYSPEEGGMGMEKPVKL